MTHSKTNNLSIGQRIARLPIPTFGRYTPLIGLAGLIGVTLVGSLLAGIVLRALLTHSATGGLDGVDFASMTTPHPDFAVPMLTGSEPDRFTVLLLGADTRPAETGYRMPTDTIMLLTIDTQQQHAGMLSVPRDLYVDIPGFGLDRINTAYVEGGGALAMETIKRNLGVSVDRYILVQFDAFTTIVDEIGGVDIYVPYTIDDPTFPAECYSRDDCGFDPLTIEAGQHHFDGQTALRYARTRHGDNDYERARRQQAVIMAVRQRVLSFDMLPTLITKAPSLYATLSQSISTNMSLDELIELAQAASSLPDDSIRSEVIDAGAVTSTRAPNGASVLMPNHDRVKELIELVFWMR
jgi:LCP family protein required for cell wall assembly